MNTQLQVETNSSHKIKNCSVSTQLCIGAIAGACSRTGTAPLERLKTLYQVSQTKPPSIYTGMKNMYFESGLVGMWRGNLANVLKSAPSSSVKFFTYEYMKLLMINNFSSNGVLSAAQLFLCGSVAGITSHVAFFPMEVIKTRLSIARNGMYNGIVDCGIQTMKYEGIRPFYRGLSASIMSTIPHAGINLMMYEVTKRFLQTHSSDHQFHVYNLMIASAISSACSQVVVYPVRTIKARMIMHGMPNQCISSTELYSGGVLDIAKNVVQNEGFRGLFKGFYVSLLRTVPANMITFTVYDSLKRKLSDY
jgi:solute carrier family 25 phosphate transporter 23/24/25/41